MNGIVMDIKDKRAIVYCSDGRILETADRHYEIGQTVSFRRHGYIKYIAAAACFLMFTIAGFSGHHMYYTPESYVYLDINPSIRLDINRFDRVISVVPLNEDASALLMAHPISSKNADECINSIVEACREDKYINEENTDIAIEVMSSDEKLRNNVDSVSDCLRKENLKVEVSDVDCEKNRRAMNLNVSAKRLEALDAFAEAFGVDADEAAENLSGVTTKEIYRQIENHGKKDDVPKENPSEKASDNGRENKPDSAPQNQKTEKNTPSSNKQKNENAQQPGKAPEGEKNRLEEKNTEERKNSSQGSAQKNQSASDNSSGSQNSSKNKKSENNQDKQKNPKSNSKK